MALVIVSTGGPVPMCVNQIVPKKTRFFFVAVD